MANWNSSAWKVGLPADQLAKVEELESELENYRKDGRDRQLQVWKVLRMRILIFSRMHRNLNLLCGWS